MWVSKRNTLEDRIRTLCRKAVSAKEPELTPILAELRFALREHIQFMRRMTAATLKPLQAKIVHPSEIDTALQKTPE